MFLKLFSLLNISGFWPSLALKLTPTPFALIWPSPAEWDDTAAFVWHEKLVINITIQSSSEYLWIGQNCQDVGKTKETLTRKLS